MFFFGGGEDLSYMPYHFSDETQINEKGALTISLPHPLWAEFQKTILSWGFSNNQGSYIDYFARSREPCQARHSAVGAQAKSHQRNVNPSVLTGEGELLAVGLDLQSSLLCKFCSVRLALPCF